jgi:hypothetical protein
MEQTETTVKLDIGGICVLVASLHADIIAHVQDRYCAFLSEDAPDFEVEMAFTEDVYPADYLDVPLQTVETLRVRSGGDEWHYSRPGHTRPGVGTPCGSSRSRRGCLPSFEDVGSIMACYPLKHKSWVAHWFQKTKSVFLDGQ